LSCIRVEKNPLLTLSAKMEPMKEEPIIVIIAVI
jgi:hypothetical protein